MLTISNNIEINRKPFTLQQPAGKEGPPGANVDINPSGSRNMTKSLRLFVAYTPNSPNPKPIVDGMHRLWTEPQHHLILHVMNAILRQMLVDTC